MSNTAKDGTATYLSIDNVRRVYDDKRLQGGYPMKRWLVLILIVLATVAVVAYMPNTGCVGTAWGFPLC